VFPSAVTRTGFGKACDEAWNSRGKTGIMLLQKLSGVFAEKNVPLHGSIGLQVNN